MFFISKPQTYQACLLQYLIVRVKQACAATSHILGFQRIKNKNEQIFDATAV